MRCRGFFISFHFMFLLLLFWLFISIFSHFFFSLFGWDWLIPDTHIRNPRSSRPFLTKYARVEQFQWSRADVRSIRWNCFRFFHFVVIHFVSSFSVCGCVCVSRYISSHLIWMCGSHDDVPTFLYIFWIFISIFAVIFLPPQSNRRRPFTFPTRRNNLNLKYFDALNMFLIFHIFSLDFQFEQTQHSRWRCTKDARIIHRRATFAKFARQDSTAQHSTAERKKFNFLEKGKITRNTHAACV